MPPKLSARARVFATGQGRKTDATDAHPVALVGTRMSGLRPVVTALIRVMRAETWSIGAERQIAHVRRWKVYVPVGSRVMV